MKTLRILLLLVSALQLACTAVVQKVVYPPDAEVLQRALAGELLLGHSYTEAELPQVNLFELTPEMKAFAEQVAARGGSGGMRAEYLHQQLILPQTAGGRGMSYSALSVNTGIEAFAQRQANCLSYTLLYVGLARHIGLNAQFNEVILPPTWSMRDQDTYLFLRHVNAKVLVRKRIWGGWVRDASTADIGDVVVDLELRRYRPNYRQYALSDTAIASQFYSNRGLELAAAGDLAQGFLHLRKALLLDDELSYVWSNLASIYRRQGYNAEAEALYLQGLRINNQDLTVMHNLAGLYKDLGNSARAVEFEAQVRNHRNANPYYIYRGAELKRAKGDLQGAAQAIEQALKKQADEPLFYEFAIAVYTALGEPQKVQRLRAKLARITP